MFDRTSILSALTSATLAVLPLSSAGAAQTFRVAAFDIPAVAGAMNESRYLARSADEVRKQGGFATAGAVLWLPRAPAEKLAAF